MKRIFAWAIVFAAIVSTPAALAQTLPDGPVAGPPGWSCMASGGKVFCVKEAQR